MRLCAGARVCGDRDVQEVDSKCGAETAIPAAETHRLVILERVSDGCDRVFVHVGLLDAHSLRPLQTGPTTERDERQANPERSHSCRGSSTEQVASARASGKSTAELCPDASSRGNTPHSCAKHGLLPAYAMRTGLPFASAVLAGPLAPRLLPALPVFPGADEPAASSPPASSPPASAAAAVSSCGAASPPSAFDSSSAGAVSRCWRALLSAASTFGSSPSAMALGKRQRLPNNRCSAQNFCPGRCRRQRLRGKRACSDARSASAALLLAAENAPRVGGCGRLRVPLSPANCQS